MVLAVVVPVVYLFGLTEIARTCPSIAGVKRHVDRLTGVIHRSLRVVAFRKWDPSDGRRRQVRSSQTGVWYRTRAPLPASSLGGCLFVVGRFAVLDDKYRAEKLSGNLVNRHPE